METYNRKILTVTSICLFALGATIGAIAAWQVLINFPALSPSHLHPVYITVCAIFVAILLALSAKAVYFAVSAIASTFAKLVKEKGAVQIVAAVVGMLGGIGIVFLIDMLARNYVFVAVRVILDTVAALIFVPSFAAVGIYFVNSN